MRKQIVTSLILIIILGLLFPSGTRLLTPVGYFFVALLVLAVVNVLLPRAAARGRNSDGWVHWENMEETARGGTDPD